MVHTSVLTRAIQTADLALDALGQLWLPGPAALAAERAPLRRAQGLDKKQTAEQLRAEQSKLWRRSYDVPPPPVDLDDAEHPRNDARYAPARRPTSCLRPSASQDVVVRVLPYWYDAIVPDLRAGYGCWSSPTATACGRSSSTSRASSDADIAELNIPTGHPPAVPAR